MKSLPLLPFSAVLIAVGPGLAHAQQPLSARGIVFATAADSVTGLADASVTIFVQSTPDSTQFLAARETSGNGRFVLRVSVPVGTDCQNLRLQVRKEGYRSAEVRSLCGATRLEHMSVQLFPEPW